MHDLLNTKCQPIKFYFIGIQIRVSQMNFLSVGGSEFVQLEGYMNQFIGLCGYMFRILSIQRNELW